MPRTMIRVLGSAFGLAILAAVLTHNTIVFWVVFAIGLAGSVVPLLAGTTALKCPHCRKRVKLGASACHHCGRAVARNAS